jgi:hypothetical protein
MEIALELACFHVTESGAIVNRESHPFAVPVAPIAPIALLPSSLSALNPVLRDDLKRYGCSGDGGYVLPRKSVDGIDGLLSFGLSYDWTFEKDVAAHCPGIPIHVYDHTAGVPALRRNVAAGLVKLIAGRIGGSEFSTRVARFRDYGRFFVGETRRHFRERIYNRKELPFDATIDHVFARMEGRRNLLLKMDIECGEYRVIPQILGYADRIRLMVIEFHETEPYRAVFLQQVEAILSEFEVAHIHGNNYTSVAADGFPDAVEVTFIKRNGQVESARRNRLPLVGLDYPCDPARGDLPLVFR